MAGIPTIIFGPGDLKLAHGDDEHITLEDIITAARLYAAFAVVACNSENQAR
jgi:acetylornithine deacetylase